MGNLELSENIPVKIHDFIASCAPEMMMRLCVGIIPLYLTVSFYDMYNLYF